MPILFEIDHASQFVHARTHGVVSLQDILDYMDAVTIQDAAAYPKLFDATDGDLQLPVTKNVAHRHRLFPPCCSTEDGMIQVDDRVQAPTRQVAP